MPKVLLAEDDVTMVRLLKTLLKMEGFEIIPVNAEDDVPSLIKRQRPDVVLLDVNLFNKNGLEILDKIRSDKSTANVRVVMASGMDVKDECVKRGANAFLLKPYMPDDLIHLLRQNLPRT